jgi:hypothetical protein
VIPLRADFYQSLIDYYIMGDICACTQNQSQALGNSRQPRYCGFATSLSTASMRSYTVLFGHTPKKTFSFAPKGRTRYRSVYGNKLSCLERGKNSLSDRPRQKQNTTNPNKRKMGVAISSHAA